MYLNQAAQAAFFWSILGARHWVVVDLAGRREPSRGETG